MKIFLTGATGFIGRRLMEALLAENHDILALVRTREDAEKISQKGVRTLKASLENISADMIGNTDAIIHLAAIRYEWGHPWKDYKKINIEATEKLLEAAREIGAKKFILGSTVFVFGYPKKMPINETFPYAPTTRYAKSKVEAEKLVKKFSKEDCFETIILRPTITYGPGDTKGMLLKLAKLVRSRKFAIIGDGENFIHLTHVDDVVRGFLKALGTKEKSNDFILASPEAISQKELANLVAKELDTKIFSLKIPRWLAKFAGFLSEMVYNLGMKSGMRYFFREPFISRSKVDILSGSQKYTSEKAEELLGFKARINPKIGIRETINWYKKENYIRD